MVYSYLLYSGNLNVASNSITIQSPAVQDLILCTGSPNQLSTVLLLKQPSLLPRYTPIKHLSGKHTACHPPSQHFYFCACIIIKCSLSVFSIPKTLFLKTLLLLTILKHITTHKTHLQGCEAQPPLLMSHCLGPHNGSVGLLHPMAPSPPALRWYRAAAHSLGPC